MGFTFAPFLQCLLLQAFVIVFCHQFAGFQRFVVKNMINHGATEEESKQFHRYSFMVRFLFGGALALGQFVLGTGFEWGNLALELVYVLVRGMIYGTLMLIFFDGFLNRMTGKPFEYTGNTAKTDRYFDSLVKNDEAELRLIIAGVGMLEVVHLCLDYFF